MKRHIIFPFVFFTGAQVMVLEILGTRLIIPYFGSSIYVWSAQISITLLALSVGYYLGGRYGVRRAHRLFLGILYLSSIYIALLPLAGNFILLNLIPAGPVLGAFIAAVVLFFLPLAGLGMSCPFLLSYLDQDISSSENAGRLLAVSTVGSIFGSSVLVLVCLRYFSLGWIFLCAGILLLFMTVVLHVTFTRSFRSGMLTGLVLAIGIISFQWITKSEASSAMIFHKHSLYYDIKVVKQEGARTLLLDNVLNSKVAIPGFHSTLLICNLMAELPNLNPEFKRVLVIGLGAGSIARTLSHREIECEAVEIDQDVVNVARTYFDLPASVPVHTMDGREFFHKYPDKRFDLILWDAYSPNPPPHLLTQEFFQLIKIRLNEGGGFGLNIVDFNRPGGADMIYLQSIVKTLNTVFKDVQTFRGVYGNREKNDELQNFLILAGDVPVIQASAIPRTSARNEFLWNIFSNPVDVVYDRGYLFSDNYSPIDQLNADFVPLMLNETMKTQETSVLGVF